MEREFFKNPEGVRELNEAQVPLWFWNDKLENEELENQLARMSEKGVTGNAPHARTGFEGNYLDEAWMDHIGTVIRYKESRNETMWIYDEFNWPAGIANGEVTRHEEFREKYLSLERFYIPANTRFRRQLAEIRKSKVLSPGDMETDLNGKKRINNLFCFDAETMERLDITQFQPEDKDGFLFSMSESDFEICRGRDTILYEAKIRMEDFRGDGFFTPDYMNEKATEKFVDITYEAYYKQFPHAFGKVITAGFNDETRFCHAFPWTDSLLEDFEKRYGYRLEEKLPDLVLPGVKAGRTRCDYFNLISDLYRNNYHRVIREWCEGHHIDYCPHLLGEETMAGQVRFGGDFMRQMKEVSRPGVDHLGKGIGSLNVKFAASAAEVYGKEGLVCEVFAACGWELTFEEYIRMISWLYSQGIKTVTNHGFFYSIRDFRKDDWPPSQFFQWQGWDRMKQANEMCRRIYGMTKDSPRRTEVLIYHPTESYWLHYIADQGFTHGYHMGPIVQGERAAQIDRQEQILLNGLQEQNRDFTVFPSDAVSEFGVSGGKLVNKTTGLAYEAFILPMCEVLPLKVAQMLDEFLDQGGKLAVIETVPGYGMNPGEDEQVQSLMKRILESSGTVFFETMNTEQVCRWLNQECPQELKIIEGLKVCKKSRDHYPDWVIDPYIHTGEDVDGVSWCAFGGEERKYYFVNYTREEQNLVLEVVSKKQPEIWDTFTGKIKEAEVIGKVMEGAITKYRIRMSLPQNYGVFLVTDK